MKEISLTKGKVAIVSDEDFAYLSQFKWTASLESRGTKWYAIRWSRKHEHGEGKRYKVRMHRTVVYMTRGAIDNNDVVDHKDGNSLNNQRENLEAVTQTENMHRVSHWKGSRTWAESREPFL